MESTLAQVELNVVLVLAVAQPEIVVA